MTLSHIHPGDALPTRDHGDQQERFPGRWWARKRSQGQLLSQALEAKEAKHLGLPVAVGMDRRLAPGGRARALQVDGALELGLFLAVRVGAGPLASLSLCPGRGKGVTVVCIHVLGRRISIATPTAVSSSPGTLTFTGSSWSPGTVLCHYARGIPGLETGLDVPKVSPQVTRG